MNFSDQSPSKHWAALTLRGERIAEVWFKPEGDALALVFRIPQSSFQIAGIGERLTAESLLKTVGIATGEVESWHHGDVFHSALDRSDQEFANPLPQSPSNVAHLEIHVRLKPPAQAMAQQVNCEPDVARAQWHDLEARWKALMGLEAAVDTQRKSVEGARAELEASLRWMMPADEKVHALAADVAQWNKAKNRAHYALPKASEFIHRAIWAAGTPERKRLGEIFKNPIESLTSLPPADEVQQEIDFLRKDWQVLSTQGVTVYQECKAISADVQGALRRLQTNAAVRASKKKGGTGAKGKSY